MERRIARNTKRGG